MYIFIYTHVCVYIYIYIYIYIHSWYAPILFMHHTTLYHITLLTTYLGGRWPPRDKRGVCWRELGTAARFSFHIVVSDTRSRNNSYASNTLTPICSYPRFRSLDSGEQLSEADPMLAYMPLSLSLYIYIYIFIIIIMIVIVIVIVIIIIISSSISNLSLSLYIYIYIYMYICPGAAYSIALRPDARLEFPASQIGWHKLRNRVLIVYTTNFKSGVS